MPDTEGRVPVDNNETEQQMKQLAKGRKNRLIIGSVEAGCRASILMTIVIAAHCHHLDVWQYVKDVLDRLLQGARTSRRAASALHRRSLLPRRCESRPP